MTANVTRPLQAARLDATPRSGPHDDLCDRTIIMGRLDADALNAL